MQSTSVGSVTCPKSKKSPLVAGITRGKCRRPLLELGASSAGDGVEGGVDEAGGVVFVKGPGDIDIFGDDHLGGDILAAQQLEGGGAQNGAQGGIDALHRPAVSQRLIDRRVDFELVLGYAPDDLTEEVGVGGQILLTLDLTAEMEGAELGERIFQGLTAHIHLIESLHRSKASGAPLIGWPMDLRVSFGNICHLCVQLCLKRGQGQCGTSGIAAPVLLILAGADPGLRFILDGQDADA